MDIKLMARKKKQERSKTDFITAANYTITYLQMFETVDFLLILTCVLSDKQQRFFVEFLVRKLLDGIPYVLILNLFFVFLNWSIDNPRKIKFLIFG